MPTTPIATFINQPLMPLTDPDDAILFPVNLADGTYVAGQVLGELTATPGTFGAYDSAAATGLQNAKAILKFGCVAASGVITGIYNNDLTDVSVPAYFANANFNMADLTGLTANAVTSLKARILIGVLGTGVVRLP